MPFRFNDILWPGIHRTVEWDRTKAMRHTNEFLILYGIVGGLVVFVISAVGVSLWIPVTLILGLPIAMILGGFVYGVSWNVAQKRKQSMRPPTGDSE